MYITTYKEVKYTNSIIRVVYLSPYIIIIYSTLLAKVNMTTTTKTKNTYYTAAASPSAAGDLDSAVSGFSLIKGDVRRR